MEYEIGAVQAKTDDEKAAKRARKKQEMKEYFNELYGEKEKVRLAEKQKRKAF